MATIRELQAKFTASTKGMRTAVKGVVDDLKGMQKETQKVNKETQKTASDSKGAYRTMADGSKVYRDSMGKLRDEMGRFVQEQDTILQNASRSQKFFDGLGNSAITAGNKVQSISTQINSVGNMARDFGGTLTKYVTLPVAGLATLLGGTALSKGFSRLLDIDTAQAKLKGLGHDAQNVETIMNNATDSVKGTAFGLGEAATTAANAVAAGIEPGEELTKYLTLTGDAAAIAGTDMNEMGSIFNKVQTNNKIQAEEMNQLLDRGVPIIKLLADQLNVAEGDVRDLAAAGEISAEDFLAAVDKGFGGAAKIMGETSLSAAIDNMWASVGRIGANFLDAGGKAGGFFSQMKPLIGELTEWFSSLEDNAADWGVKFGEVFSDTIEWMRDFIGQLKALDDWQKKLIGWGAAIAVALGPILTVLGSIAIFISKVGFAIAPLITGFGKMSKAVADAGGLMVWLRTGLATLAKRFSFLLGPVGIAVGIILTLGTAFVTAYNKSETFRNFINGIGERVKNAISWLTDFKDGIIGLFKDEGDSGVDILKSIGLSDAMVDTLFDITGYMMEFYYDMKEKVDLVKGIFEGMLAMFRGDWTDGVSILKKLGLTDEQIAGIQTFVMDIMSRFNILKLGISSALSAVGTFFKDIFADLSAWWASDGSMILSAVSTAFKFAFDLIKSVVDFGIRFVIDLFKQFAPIVMGIFDVLWPTIVYLTQTAWSTLKLVIGTAMDLIKGIISAVSALIEGDWSKFGEILKSTALSIKDRVVQFFGELKNNALQLFQNLTGGAIQKFKDMRDRVIEWVLNLVARAIWEWERMKVLTEIKIRTMVAQVKQFFQDLWTNVTNKAMSLKNAVVQRFTELKDGAINRITNMRNSVVSWFQNLWSNVTAKARQIKDNVVSRFNELKDGAINRVSSLYNSVSSWFTNIYNTIRDKMRNAKDKAVGFATDLYDGAKAQFENLSSAASDMMDKIGQWIDDKKEAVVGKAKSLGIDIANGAINGFNKMIGGINNVADLLGYDGTLISEIPTYSTGTNYHPGGAAIVGDKGPGNSVGGGGSSTREIIELPNGKRFLADGNVLIPNAPRGMKVKNNRATEKELSGGSGSNVFSRTAKSIGDFAKSTTDKVVTGTKNAVGKVVDTADAVWEYAKNPGALLDDIIGSIDFALPTEALELAKLGLGKLKSIATDYIKELFSGAEGAGDGSHILGKQIYQYFGRYGIGGSLGLNFNAGKHYGIDTAHKHEPLLSPINGVVTRIWNDYGGGNSLQVDAGKYTWWFMHLSKVLASLGERITAGQKIAITGATGNFISGSGHLHTQVMEGGVGNAYAIDPLPILKNLKGAGSAVTGVASKIGGYFRGGITSGFPELAWLNEEGFRESIISHNPAHRERSESIWQTTGDKLGFGGNSEETKLLRQQNELLIELIGVNEEHKDVSEGILRKPGISDSDIVEAYDRKTYDDDLVQRIYKGRKK